MSVGKFQYILNGLIVAGFAVVGRNFIGLWMGQDYMSAYWGILLVLIPGLFYNALQIANTTMVVTNKVKVTALVSIVTGVVNVCLSFPLSSHFGVTGACMSIGTAYLIRDILLNVIYHRELPLDIPRFIKECYLRMSVPMVLTIVCGLWINRWIADGGWIIFFVKATITAGIYCVTTWFLALSRQERRKLLEWMKR